MGAELVGATTHFFNASRIGSILSGVLSGAVVAAFGYRAAFIACAALARLTWKALAKRRRRS